MMISRIRVKPLLVVCFLSVLIFQIRANAATPVETVLSADLAAKYSHYRENYMARHIDRGGTIEALLDDATKTKVVKYWGAGDSQGWTGLTMAAFAFQGDWDLVRTNLTYWPLVEVEPGRYKRFPEQPNNDPDPTSIDQYGEMLMGMTAVWLLGPDDLKEEIKRITKNMMLYGNSHNWIMGTGPYTDCDNIRFLFQLLSLQMKLGIDAYRPGEDYEKLRQRFFAQFKQAYLVRHGTPRYFTLNLFFERMFVAKLLAPDLPGLDKAIKEWHKVVEKDDDVMFDWFYSRVLKKDTSFVLDKLRAFPQVLPNEWTPNGYNLGYRWERSPDEKAEAPDGRSVEYTGMDFMALASFYSYFEKNDFGH